MNHRQKKKKKKKQKAKKVKSVNSENSANAKTYNCSACTNSYASISGLRGHLRKKHGITNAKGKYSPNHRLNTWLIFEPHEIIGRS